MIVQDGAAQGRVQDRAIVADWLGVNNVLIGVRGRQVNRLAAITQADRRKSFEFPRVQRQQYFVNVCEGTTSALGAWLAFSQVIQAEHHVLRRNGDRLS